MKRRDAQRGVRVLVALSEPIWRQTVVEGIRDRGYDVTESSSGEQALDTLCRGVFDVVIASARFGTDLTGVAALHAIRAVQPDAQVLILGEKGSAPAVPELLAGGAFHCLPSSVTIEELAAHLGRALAHRQLLLEVQFLRRQWMECTDLTRLVGESPALKDVRERLAVVAQGRSSVLVRGEAGTGKSLVARLIHDLGPRRQQPFAVIDCRQPAAFLEAEVFGTRGGSSGGAAPNRHGMIEEASGGTLVLREVAAFPPGLQVKLLATLRTHRLRRAGGNSGFPVDVRVVSLDSGGLARKQNRGKFHHDLADRLSAVEIDLPPLREHSADIPALAAHFLGILAKEVGTPYHLSREALPLLSAWNWPGNVRELEGVLRYAAKQSPEGVLMPESLPAALRANFLPEPVFADLRGGLPSLDELAGRYIAHVLKVTGGNKAEASAILGVARSSLYRKRRPASRPYREECRDA